MSVIPDTTFNVSPGPKVTVIKRDREAEHNARRNAKSAMESLALLYPQQFREVADKVLLGKNRVK